jgi:hypothetical protein
MESAKLIVEVTAGVVPGKVEPEYTRLYAITSAQWQEAMNSGATMAASNLLAETNGKAQGYAGYLMLQPDHLNWVDTKWLWL